MFVRQRRVMQIVNIDSSCSMVSLTVIRGILILYFIIKDVHNIIVIVVVSAKPPPQTPPPRLPVRTGLVQKSITSPGTTTV